MDVFAGAEKLMRMDDRVWARHANPWSVWTRMSTLPLLVLAVWSRVWLGWWALVPVALALVWTFVNPRLFSPPADTESWAAHGTFGERVFLARRERPIPRHHERAAWVLTALSSLGVPILAYGLVVLDAWATICGLSIVVIAKLWFVDRMVWLYRETRAASSGRDDATGPVVRRRPGDAAPAAGQPPSSSP